MTNERGDATQPARPPDRAEGQPRITVVTPAYNSAPLLEECIVSILDQRYPNLEYFVIDGGSTDGTLEIIRKYESRIDYWTSEQDSGQTEALNKGFRRATGDIVCWLNSDDFFYPGALSAVAEAYVADPSAPFYFGNGYRVNLSGRKIGEFFRDGQVHFRRDALIFGLNTVLQPAAFIRRASLEEVGLLDESLHYGFDSNLWIDLSALGQPRAIRKHLAASREFGTTKTSTGSFRRAEELRRIAERHAAVAATPGSISYYLETLHRLAATRSDVFPPGYLSAIETFWSETSKLLSNYGARPDGFPIPDLAEFARGEQASRPNDGRTRIGIELRQVARGVSGGIVVVLVGTLLKLFESRPDFEFTVFCTVFNRELLTSGAENVELITLPLDGFFSEAARLARERGIDLFIRSYPTVEELDFPLKRQIFVIPDIQHEQHPSFFDSASLHLRRRAFAPALQGSGGIMTISNFARETIEEFATPGRDVFVASPSLPPDFLEARAEDATDEELAALTGIDAFFYFPANLWPHKNHERLFQAFQRFLARSNASVSLVLTGSPRGWEELRARYPDLPVRHLGYVSPALVKVLYQRAIALVFFSEYEGFGIPLLEAFAVGTPVVCSNTTSLPEVAGDAALMCDPTDIDAIADLLERVAGDADLRALLVTRGRERLSRYSWKEAASQLSDGIDRVLGRVRLPALNESPLVSIVTPSFNQGRFIRATIDSVLAQTYPNIEYLVVDGASTDETVDILCEYGDRVRWVSEPDDGQTAAINKGLRIARGEIVGYLNSDDVLLPHAIESVVEYLRKHPECDLVYGDADEIDESGAIIGRYPTADYAFERLLQDCCISQPAAYWRAAVAETVGLFDETMQYAMDFDYWIRVDRSGFALQHMPETIAQARQHPDMKTLTARAEIYGEIIAISREKGGYVSTGYVNGYWHHLAFERPYHVARLLRRTRRLRGSLVLVHHAWLNRHQYTRKRWLVGSAKVARRGVISVLQRTPRVLAVGVRVKRRLRTVTRGARGSLRRTSPVSARTSSAQPRVRGYWSDNWVEERLDVVVDARDRDELFRIMGRPIAGMTVEVSARGRQIGRFELEAGHQEEVVVKLPSGPRETISFCFSDRIIDREGRSLSFLLDETNLFGESDLAAQV